MNTPKLDWFLSVAEVGGISKAAEKLFASQQSVSAYIKRLEAFYGVTLFRRSPGFALTASGIPIRRFGTTGRAESDLALPLLGPRYFCQRLSRSTRPATPV